jgi:hypothetical protein
MASMQRPLTLCRGLAHAPHSPLFLAHLQAFHAPRSLHALAVDLMTFPSEQRRDASVAIPRMFLAQQLDLVVQRMALGAALTHEVKARTRQAQGPARLCGGSHVQGGVASEGDEFDTKASEQIRVLRLVESRTSSVESRRSFECVVEIWQPEVLPHGHQRERKKSEKTKWKLVETRTPLRLGKPLPLLPFVFHGPQHSRPDVDKLPLDDIIAVNLDHYRLNADYKHGVHYTALPTAWVSGFDKEATLRIGSSTAWVADNPNAKAGYLEFTGQGLTTFERAMDRDERLMSLLGSRLLENNKKVGETAEAIELRQTGEHSILGNIALSVSESLSQVMRWAYWWNSTEENPEDVSEEQVALELNTDFSSKGLTSQDLQAIVGAWQAGAISRETMLDLFRRGEVLPESRSAEEEEQMIEQARRTRRGFDEGLG